MMYLQRLPVVIRRQIIAAGRFGLLAVLLICNIAVTYYVFLSNGSKLTL